MSIKIEHTSFVTITEERLGEISKYKFSEINKKHFGNAINDNNLYKLLIDIMLYHPNLVVRHEASFLLGELEIKEAIPSLMNVVKFDKSIVAKHEAIEAIRKLGKNIDSVYEFLKSLTDLNSKIYDEGVYHPDVQATAELSIKELEEERKLLQSNY